MVHKVIQTFLLAAGLINCYGQTVKQSLPRKNCFFGVHFDFHANPDDDAIGKTVTAGMIDSLLDGVKPDFVQVDCKGHPGIASYPTKIGTPAKGFVKDALQLWRDETRKKSVGLYIHYSDLLDKAAVKRHPGWATVNANKHASEDQVSIFSHYEDSLLIPQLKEVIKKYKIDGVWLDGGTWAMQPDYSSGANKAFTAKTGVATLPTEKSNAAYAAFLQFERNAFADYVSRYATALHQYDKGIQICSNWLYSAMAPIPVPANIDFLSADMPFNQGDLHKVAFDARCYASQARRYNKAWDLMSWGFDDKGIRPINILCQEAAEVIAAGGVWQCYFPQNHDASINQKYVVALKEMAPFVRARQRYCQYAVPVKQVAVLFSGTSEFDKNNGLFQNDNNMPVRNAVRALLDNQLPTDVIMEHQITTEMPAYPLLVIPELGTAKTFEPKLLQYVFNGGTVLLLGTNNIDQLAKYAGVIITNKSGVNKFVTLQTDLANYQFQVPDYILQKGSAEIENLPAIKKQTDVPIATVKTYGKGRIATFLINQKSVLNDSMNEVYKKTVAAVAKKLLKNPIVEVSGSDSIHIAVNLLQKKTIVNLINTSKAANGSEPGSGSFIVKLRIPKPVRLMLQPENKSLPFTYTNGVCEVQLSNIHIHEIIVAE